MKIQMKRFVAAVLMGVMILSVLPVASVNAAESIEEETRETVGEESQGLNYVYINKSYVAEQENQDIMVSWGNEDQNIKHMMLQLEDENGKILLLEGNRYEANTVLFSSVLEKGIYHVTGLEVTTDATESVAMEEYGIHAAFGVGTEYLGEKSCYQSMESAESGTEVEYAVANLNGMDMEENAEQVAEVLSSVDTSSAVATMSLSDNEISTQSSSGQLVVVLDPGHDAKHVGARGNGVLEEVATFKIAQYCKAELQKYNGIEVRLTRDDAACPFPESTDNIDDIRKRVEWAKSIGADVFVSIHLNALEGSAAHGAEVYYPSQSGEGKELAQKIQDQLLKLGLYDRKIKAEDAYAVVNTSMANGFPGLIVEHAFLTNASDASNYLQTEEGLQKLGIADATGIATYYGLSKGYWVKTDGKWYYCNEYGVKQTGWKYINRAWYWLASDGVMQTGWCYINGQWYWFNADGEMQTGWRYINNQWYWLTSSGAMQTGWCYIDKIWYWFNADGEMQTGWLTQGNSKYYLMSSGAGATGWQVIGGKTYYFDSNCYMLTGTQIIDGTKYEFDRVSGELLKTYIQGWSYENEKWYYYDENENRIVGWSYINNEWYWFADDGEMQTDWQYINKKWYWFNNGGAMQTKWGYIDGEWYWFDENGVLQSGWLLLDGNWFYLQSSGAGAVGWKTIGGKTYYFDSNCYMLTGTQIIDGTKYEFDRVSGELLKTYIQGWSYENEKWYYYDENENRIVGWSYINNEWYWFADDGEMQTDWQYINKKWYWFNNGGAMQTKWGYIDGEWYWFDENGVLQSGWLLLDGNWFYLQSSGAGAVGWKTIGGKTYYFDSNCYMLTGTQTIDGTKYEFDRVSGELLKSYIQGWTYENENWYYYDEKGTRIVGWKYINNVWYWFNSSGAMQTGWKRIDEKWYYFNEDGYWIKQDPVEGTYLIENVSAVTVEQMVNYYNASGKEYPEAALTIGGAKDITTFCRIYLEEAESEGIAVEVAFAQAMKETNWLHFGGDVKIEQFNFAGLGAIGGGVTGLDFSSYGEDGVRMGIRAHIQHLKAYASSEITENTLKNPCVDSRFKYVTKGCAKYVEWLGQKENPDSYGWATETKYGISIVGMINKMKQF